MALAFGHGQVSFYSPTTPLSASLSSATVESSVFLKTKEGASLNASLPDLSRHPLFASESYKATRRLFNPSSGMASLFKSTLGMVSCTSHCDASLLLAAFYRQAVPIGHLDIAHADAVL